jgi:hypothetical protein
MKLLLFLSPGIYDGILIFSIERVFVAVEFDFLGHNVLVFRVNGYQPILRLSMFPDESREVEKNDNSFFDNKTTKQSGRKCEKLVWALEAHNQHLQLKSLSSSSFQTR